MNKGFTLIELMIIVAIIGILAAVAVPKIQEAMGHKSMPNLSKPSCVEYEGKKVTGYDVWTGEYLQWKDANGNIYRSKVATVHDGECF